MSDINKVDKKTNEVVKKINHAHLVATLYVLKEDPTNSFTKNKEENNMKIGSKFSNRTKILGGTTILLGAATIITVVKERLGMKKEEVVEELLEEVQDGVENIIYEVPGEVINF